jgi:hypothetical protein
MTPTSSLEGDLSARLNQVIIVLFYPLGSTIFLFFLTYLRYLPYQCIEQSVLRIRYILKVTDGNSRIQIRIH